jgi:hypothetical protein
MDPPKTFQTPPKHPLNAPPIPQKALKLSRKVDECKPLVAGMAAALKNNYAPAPQVDGGGTGRGRGLHSFTSELNLSRIYD